MTTTILAVDDSRTIRRAIEYTFQGSGYEVVSVPDRQQALARLREGALAAALVDAVLPGDDGYEVARSIIDHGVPVVLMTSASHPLDEPRGSDIGITTHVNKPFPTQALLDAVSEAVRTGVNVPAEVWSGDVEEIEEIDIEDVPDGPELDAEMAMEPDPGASIDLEPMDEGMSIDLDGPVATQDVGAAEPDDGFELAMEDPVEPPMAPEPPSMAGEPAPPEPVPEPPPTFAERSGDGPLPSPGLDQATDTVVARAQEGLPSGLAEDELRAMARHVIERVAWEVVPELAETIIREELARLTRE
jgi:CheY-like chemotaxis protein